MNTQAQPPETGASPHRLWLAPLFGLALGALVNQVRGDGLGLAMAVELSAGALIATLFAALMVNWGRWIEERVADEARRAEREKARRMAAEENKIKRERAMFEHASLALRKVKELEDGYFKASGEVQELRGMVNTLRSAMGGAETVTLADELRRAQSRLRNLETERRDTVRIQAVLDDATRRIQVLEKDRTAADEAKRRLEAIEAAQSALANQQVELTNRAKREVDEVTASLRQLVSDSQRLRNMQAADGEKDGRIIQIESRINRLAREIERLSTRTGAAEGDEGMASLVAPGGTKDKARKGFLKALLDANLTLRKQIKQAA